MSFFGRNIRDIVEDIIPEKEAEKFAEWAFGPDYKNLESKEMCDEWNKIHSDVLILDQSSNPNFDIPVMIYLWRKENED